jgi:hypothetical protein
VIVAVIAGLAMAMGDTLQALYVIALGRGRSTLAGCFDGLADLTNVISIGGGAATVYHHPIGPVTAVTFALIFVGSVVGAVSGNWLSARFTGEPPVTQSSIH